MFQISFLFVCKSYCEGKNHIVLLPIHIFHGISHGTLQKYGHLTNTRSLYDSLNEEVARDLQFSLDKSSIALEMSCSRILGATFKLNFFSPFKSNVQIFIEI